MGVGLLELLKSLAGMEQWDFSDRRSTLRIPCQIDCRLETSGGSAVDARVVDIGLRGLRLLLLGKVRKGSHVDLFSCSPKAGDPVTCRIEWKAKKPEGVLAGVSFVDDEDKLSESWLFDELKAIGQEAVQTEQRRSGVRVICNGPAKLKVEDETREVTLIDLGLGGAMVESDDDLLKSEQKVRFELGPTGELGRVLVNAEVVAAYKREPPRYGLRFETFSVGGVTDLERYLSHYYALKQTDQEAG